MSQVGGGETVDGGRLMERVKRQDTIRSMVYLHMQLGDGRWLHCTYVPLGPARAARKVKRHRGRDAFSKGP